MKYLLTILWVLISTQALAEQSWESKVLISEYNKMLNIVKESKSEGTVGGFDYKIVGDRVKLLWSLGQTNQDTTVIRIFKKRGRK